MSEYHGLAAALAEPAKVRRLELRDDWEHGELPALPASVGTLTRLEELSVWGIRSAPLPAAVVALPRLRTLRLQGLPDHQLPVELEAMVRLEELDLEQNGLTALPALDRLRALTVLRLADNHLTELPGWIAGLPRLVALDVDGNHLAELPSLAAAASLRELSCRRNRLGAADLRRLPAGLVELQLDAERIIPAALPALRTLTLRLGSDDGVAALLGAGLARLALHVRDPDVATLPGSLQHLDLRGCGLTAVPDAVLALPGLESLDLRDNPLVEVPPLPPGLRILRLDHGVTPRALDAIGALVELRELSITGCPIARLPLERLAALEVLEVTGAGLRDWPDCLAALPRLRRLRLADNQLTAVAPAIAQLTALEQLDLNRNQLTGLPDALGALPRLARIWLADNQIEVCPAALLAATALTGVTVARNPLRPGEFVRLFSRPGLRRLSR